jgi:hypothetical protein
MNDATTLFPEIKSIVVVIARKIEDFIEHLEKKNFFKEKPKEKEKTQSRSPPN